MAAGKAVIAPDQPNIREVLEHGRTALLFDPDSPEAMWQGVETLARIRRCAHGSVPQLETRCCAGILPGPAMRAASSPWPNTCWMGEGVALLHHLDSAGAL